MPDQPAAGSGAVAAASQYHWRVWLKAPFFDGTVIGARKHVVGASGSWADQEFLGYKGGFSIKIYLYYEEAGKPVTFSLTVGQPHEAVMLEPVNGARIR